MNQFLIVANFLKFILIFNDSTMKFKNFISILWNSHFSNLNSKFFLFNLSILKFCTHVSHVSRKFLKISICHSNKRWQRCRNIIVMHRWLFFDTLSRRLLIQTILSCIRNVQIVYEKLSFIFFSFFMRIKL